MNNVEASHSDPMDRILSDEALDEVKAAHSDSKDRILSYEAYPEERSHGQSLDELKARFDIGNPHRVKTHV